MILVRTRVGEVHFLRASCPLRSGIDLAGMQGSSTQSMLVQTALRHSPEVEFRPVDLDPFVTMPYHAILSGLYCLRMQVTLATQDEA